MLSNSLLIFCRLVGGWGEELHARKKKLINILHAGTHNNTYLANVAASHSSLLGLSPQALILLGGVTKDIKLTILYTHILPFVKLSAPASFNAWGPHPSLTYRPPWLLLTSFRGRENEGPRELNFREVQEN